MVPCGRKGMPHIGIGWAIRPTGLTIGTMHRGTYRSLDPTAMVFDSDPSANRPSHPQTL